MRKQSVQKSIASGDTAEDLNVAKSEDEQEIAQLAYELWMERGQPEGSPEEDWFRARDLVRTGRSAVASSIVQ